MWGGSTLGRIDSGADRPVTSYIMHPGGNFRCEYSVLELVQTQNGNITKCTSIN